jgi:hypothetical protein
MANATTVQQLIDYYVNLLIIQYHNKPKAQATIAAVVQELLASGVFFDVRDGFSVDTAVGVQLDIIGKYVGVDRFYKTQDITGIHFGYSDAYSFEPDGTTGYADAADFLTKDGSFLSVSDIIGTGFKLSDDDFRALIRLKILLNNSNFSDGQIDADLFAIFGTSLYAMDNLDMSMEYFTNADLSLIVRVALAKNLLPAPMGVRINHLIEENVYFGYSDSGSMEPMDVTGYASAADFFTKDGTFMGAVNFIA